MSSLIRMGSCPMCQKGTDTPCFAEYVDGYHCFSCGAHKKLGGTNYAYRPATAATITSFPHDTTNTVAKFSPNVLEWLYSYYVFDAMIRDYRIMYCKDKEDSLVFPVIKDNEIKFWQQRYFPTKRFKTGGNKSEIFYIKHDSNKLVLVEDYISAIRVASFANVICLWGTHMNYDMSNFIDNIDMTNVSVWLDPDAAGQDAAKKIFNRLENKMHYLSGTRAFAIREQRTLTILDTEKQPKQYSDTELKSILGA